MGSKRGQKDKGTKNSKTKEIKDKTEKGTGHTQLTNSDLDSLLTIESPDINEIEKYLHDLSRSSDEKKQAFENAKRDKKYLFNAANKGNLPLVELLIGFNFSTIAFDGMTQAHLTEKLLEGKSKNFETQEKFKEIAAYIYFRAKWQSKTISEETFSLNCTLRMLFKGMNTAKGLDRNVALVFGRTQRGKSTFVNYLLGTDYDLVPAPSGIGTVAQPSGGHKETVGVGDSISSYTLYPSICPVPNTTYTLVDMPGFSDVRGSEEEICTILSSQILLKNIVGPYKVSAIIFVLRYEDLNEPAYTSLRTEAAKIGKILKDLGNSNRLLFVISQIPENISNETVKNHVVFHLGRLKININEHLIGISPELEVDKRNALLALESISRNQANTFAGDIFTGNLRKMVLEKLGSLNSSSVPPDNFDFCFSPSYKEGSYNIYVARFYNAMKLVVSDYNILKNDLKKKALELEKYINLLKEAGDKQKRLNEEMAETAKKSNNKEDIVAANICVSFGKKEISIMENKSKEFQEKIDELKADQSIYTIKSWLYNETQKYPEEMLEIINMPENFPVKPATPNAYTTLFSLLSGRSNDTPEEAIETQIDEKDEKKYERKKKIHDEISQTKRNGGLKTFEAAKDIIMAKRFDAFIIKKPFDHSPEPHAGVRKDIAGFKITAMVGCKAEMLSVTNKNGTERISLEANKLYNNKPGISELHLEIKGLYKHQGEIKFVCEVYGFKNQSNESIDEIKHLENEIEKNKKGIEEERRVLVRRNDFLARQAISGAHFKGLETELQKLNEELDRLREEEKVSRANYDAVLRTFSANSKCFKQVQELLRIIGYSGNDSGINEFLNENINTETTNFKRRRESIGDSISGSNNKLPRQDDGFTKSPSAIAPNSSLFPPPPAISRIDLSDSQEHSEKMPGVTP